MNGATYSYNVPPHIISGFFRLKMQDVDGKYKYSDITSANLPCSKTNWFVMGNPVVSGTETSINISKLDDTFNDCNVLVFDIVGKKILQQNFSLRQGTQTIILNTNAIKAGTYIIGIYDTNNRPLGEVKKLVIQ